MVLYVDWTGLGWIGWISGWGEVSTVLINEKRRIEPTDMLKEAFMKVLRTVLMAK